MRLSAIVLKLKYEGIGKFENRVSGAAELQEVLANMQRGQLNESLFVIPGDEEARKDEDDNEYTTGTNQAIIENFSVLVVLRNDYRTRDIFGFTAYDRLHDIRDDLLNALLEWVPLGAEGPIKYRRARLVDLNPAYLWYAYNFSYQTRLTEQGFQCDDQVDEHTQKIWDISINIAKLRAGDQVGDEYRDLNESQLIELLPEPEVPVAFNTIYTNIINAPSKLLPHLTGLPLSDGFPNVTIPDIAQLIDMTKHPEDGSYLSSAFSKGFNLNKIFDGKDLNQ